MIARLIFGRNGLAPELARGLIFGFTEKSAPRRKRLQYCGEDENTFRGDFAQTFKTKKKNASKEYWRFRLGSKIARSALTRHQ